MYDRLLVKRDEAASVSDGGIIIPDAAKSRMNSGTVMSVGEGRLCQNLPGYQFMPNPAADHGYCESNCCHVEPLRVKPGDRILFSAFAGVEIQISGGTLLFVREDEVIAIIREVPVVAGA